MSESDIPGQLSQSRTSPRSSGLRAVLLPAGLRWWPERGAFGWRQL